MVTRPRNSDPTNCRLKSVRHLAVAFFFVPAIASVVFGCGHTAPDTAERRAAPPQPLQTDQLRRIDELTNALLQLAPEASEKEARGVAQSAVTHAAALGRRYQIVRPPQLHNLLVKFGWKVNRAMPKSAIFHRPSCQSTFSGFKSR